MHVAEPPQLDSGTIRLRWLDGGTFGLDRAAVFVRVPRPIWSTLLAAGLVASVDGEATVAAKRAQLTRAGQIAAWLTVAHDPNVLALRCGPDGAIADELRASRGGRE
jgi:hypothetical protein